jgi:hypothetical protein
MSKRISQKTVQNVCELENEDKETKKINSRGLLWDSCDFSKGKT